MLDGDGYVCRFSFAGDNKVHFLSRYVQTRRALPNLLTPLLSLQCSSECHLWSLCLGYRVCAGLLMGCSWH